MRVAEADVEEKQPLADLLQTQLTELCREAPFVVILGATEAFQRRRRQEIPNVAFLQVVRAERKESDLQSNLLSGCRKVLGVWSTERGF